MARRDNEKLKASNNGSRSVTPFKVCCILSEEEADLAIAAGAKAVGLVANNMPSGPGCITDDQIVRIARHVKMRHGDNVWTTLLTSGTSSDDIVRHVTKAGVNTVQLVDWVAPDACYDIRRRLPEIRLIQVIHVEDHTAVEEAKRVCPHVDVILLDSGKPSAPLRTLGGTGDLHDWSISKEIVSSVSTPVMLAGGLNADNVQAAIRTVSPFGVDICSGLRDRENNYALLPEKLQRFSEALA